YYAPIFSSLQQKQISGFLTFLWRRDPFKSKWAVLAKAFSIIRENARVGQSPLNVFLALNTPFVGIIPPKEYLEILGWQVKVSDSGQTSLERQFVPKLSTFDKDILQTDQSVNDIIQHSYERGYINVGESLFWLSIPTVVNHNVLAVHVPILSQEEAPAIVPQIDPGMAAVEPGNNNDGMAVPAEEMAAAPVDPAAAAEEVVFAPVDHAAAAEEAMVLPVQQAVNAEEAMAVHVVQGVAAEEVLIDNTDEVSSLKNRSLSPMMNAHSGQNTNDTEPLDSEQEDNNAIPGHDLEEKFGEAEYPYNEHFHPVSAPVITLDPFEGKPFDTYDIGDWIVSEMLED
ncbi:MAG: hypothetical protein M1826_005038, partial [Phylliscum demangeonii]